MTTNPQTEADFDGCNSQCRRAGQHTLTWGLCEHATQPEPTVSMSKIYTDPEDGYPSIGFDSYTVPELARLIEPALGDPLKAAAAARAIVHRNDAEQSAAVSVPAPAPTDQTAPQFIPPAAEGLPLAALDSATDGASALDAWARDPHGRNFLAHALVQLARDGWLRTEPGVGFEPVHDLETHPEPEDPAVLRHRAAAASGSGRVADETQAECGPAPSACDAESGEPCPKHEREAAHDEGEHCFCGPECAVVSQSDGEA